MIRIKNGVVTWFLPMPIRKTAGIQMSHAIETWHTPYERRRVERFAVA